MPEYLRKRGLGLSFIGLLALGLLSLSSCRSSAPKTPRARRLVLVSFDGLGEELLEHWLKTPGITTPEGLGGMAEKGLKARRVRMVNPTLTAVNHASLITGAPPSSTGIVSNTFHRPGEPITSKHSGFASPLGVSPLWERARNSGIRTGVLLWPDADGTSASRSGDFGIVWPDRALIRSKIRELDPQKAAAEKEIPSSDELQAIHWVLHLGYGAAEFSVDTAVFDGNPDGRARYDSVAVRVEGDEAWHFYKNRDWFEIRREIVAGSGGPSVDARSWSRILHLDRDTGALKIYLGEFNGLKAYPEDFSNKLLEEVGPWPGTPDGFSLGDWWLDDSRGIDLDTYIEQVERLDRYLDTIAVWVMKNEDFGLLIAYHPSPDEYEHAGLIREKSQWAYSEGNAFAAQQAMDRVGRSTDRSAATLYRGIDPAHDTLVVVSDHGHMPIHHEILINRALADAGLVKTVQDHGREKIAPDSEMAAYSAGGCSHLYLNLKGREAGGVVSPSEASELLERAAKVLADLQVEGEPVIEKIYSHDELGPLGLNHPNSGDLVIFAARGFATSSRLRGKAVQPSRYYGQHGYLNHYDALCGILMARGGPAGSGRLEEISAVDIAPRIRRWLGIR